VIVRVSNPLKPKISRGFRDLPLVIGRACLSVSKTVYLFAETQLAIGGEMTSESLGRLNKTRAIVFQDVLRSASVTDF
jgi:hypothetical protein